MHHGKLVFSRDVYTEHDGELAGKGRESVPSRGNGMYKGLPVRDTGTIWKVKELSG